jgi:transcriptional regulator with XRE-family HTH domain
MTLGSEIGERIHQKRDELGISIRELARRSDLSASFISQVERGKVNVSVDSLQRIAESLSVPILYFLHKDGLHTPSSETPSDLPSQYNPVVTVEERPKLSLPASGFLKRC